MKQENDSILSKLTVRLKDSITLNPIGSGLLLYNQNQKDKIYILTAAHNLYKDGDSFKEPIDQLEIDIFDSIANSYQTLKHSINHDLVTPDLDRDVAVLLLERATVEVITGTLPTILAIKERLATNTFTLKGFPNATKNEELVCINPVWIQKMTGVDKFQLQLTEDYSGWSTGGFSGSGVFLHANDQLYLYGIFTRYRAEEKGKVIYCQYIETVNEILEKNYLHPISYTFFGENGLTTDFFKQQVETAIANLGPRFNEKLNFRQPIALQFNDLAKDNVFKRRLLNAIDKWIIARNFNLNGGNNKQIEEIEDEFNSIKNTVVQWVSSIIWSAGQKIEVSEISSQIGSINNKIEEKRSEFYNLRWEEEKANIEKVKDYNYHPPYEREINRLREILQNNSDLLNDLKNVNISLSNHPCLIIQGDAGCGKSHLLGDIANERIKNNHPTILILGQLFRSGQNVWQNILSQLNLSCSKDEFLFSLNSIGQQIGDRVLILIDAINEGAGTEIWPGEFAGFISEFEKYPYIGIALTARTTYYDVIVPIAVRKKKEISQITHQGFKGNEYEALRLFCEHYGLEQPTLPILNPEFANPLFLHLICEAVKNSGQTKFPQGIQGISNTFGYYLNAICDRLANKREEYRLRQSIIRNVIHKVAKACFEQENRNALPIEKAIDFFDSEFPKYPHLFSDLIFENVLIKTIDSDYRTDSKFEVVYFSFERFGDFQIAEELLLPYTNEESIRVAFEENNKLGRLLKDGYWRYKGIMEAFAVLLPEKYDLEIVEVYEWSFEGEHPELLGNINEWLNQYLLSSLKWRNIESINNAKLTEWFNSGNFNIDDHSYINFLIELTTQKNHPFNSDRLFSILNPFSLPKRDSFWQEYLRYFSSEDDYANAYPIRRLIDWSWQSDISFKIDTETARLTGQTLGWVLSSTNISLRDQTTKAMVNLLEEQPEALINILNAFKNINDMYILERLYGIAYGCVLRTSKDNSIRKIAQYVFDHIFKEGNPPAHILLRDYARNTIEYSIYKKVPIVGDVSLIKPPYKSRMPANIPTEEKVKDYEVDSKTSDFSAKYKAFHNRIVHSVMEWDFGRYIVESALNDFCPVSFSMEDEYKSFLKHLPKKQREAVRFIDKMSEFRSIYTRKESNFSKLLGKEKLDEILTSMEDHLSVVQKSLKTDLNDEDYDYFITKVISHINDKERLNDRQRDWFDVRPIKRWIVQRVFELGYDGKLHGPFDSSIDSYNNRSENKIERIGKKYQWIAFYEIMAMIADNYKVKEDGWSTISKYKYYPGAWRDFLRNVDPAFVTKNIEIDENTDNELENTYPESQWWIDKEYDYWAIPDSSWVLTTQDLPDPKHIILRKDELGMKWLYLKAYLKWSEPKPLGKDKYGVCRKEIWYMLQGYLVHKQDKSKIIKWLQKQNFWGRWLPESHKTNTSLFNRENYWSPASRENEREVWETIKKTRYRVIATTSEAVGELSQDKSGAHFRYEMPCKMIFEGMNLQYAKVDGEFNNEQVDKTVEVVPPISVQVVPVVSVELVPLFSGI